MFADALREHAIDAWVLWDFRGSNPVLWEVLGMDPPGTSRRAVLVLPADGEPRLLCSVLDRPLLEHAAVPLDVYADRHGLVERLAALRGRVAMETSPHDALPIVDFAPAGAVELIRSLGCEVVSSAGVFQAVAAAWDDEAAASHHRAVEQVMDLHALARAHARGSTERRAGDPHHRRDRPPRPGHGRARPGVSVGANSGDPHHEPGGETIAGDEVLLVDIWAREDAPAHRVRRRHLDELHRPRAARRGSSRCSAWWPPRATPPRRRPAVGGRRGLRGSTAPPAP